MLRGSFAAFHGLRPALLPGVYSVLQRSTFTNADRRVAWEIPNGLIHKTMTFRPRQFRSELHQRRNRRGKRSQVIGLPVQKGGKIVAIGAAGPSGTEKPVLARYLLK